MAQGCPKPGEKYRHFKNKLYQILTVAYHSETQEPYVVYQALYGDFKTYIRPYEMFISEVDHKKYPDVKDQWRFTLLEDTYFQSQEDDFDMEAKLLANVEELLESKPDVQSVSDTKIVCGNDAEEEEEDGFLDEEESFEDTSVEKINPWLDRFLDARDFNEKYQIICDMQRDLSNRLIDDIAVVMDVEIPDGKLMERYAELKRCASTRWQYESGRKR